MTPRLISLTFASAPPLPGIRASASTTIKIGATDGPFRDWQVRLRGAFILLISPKGWRADSYDRNGGERRVYEFPRDLAALTWEIDGDDFEPLKDWTQEMPRTTGIATSPGIKADLTLPHRGTRDPAIAMADPGKQGGHMTPTFDTTDAIADKYVGDVPPPPEEPDDFDRAPVLPLTTKRGPGRPKAVR